MKRTILVETDRSEDGKLKKYVILELQGELDLQTEKNVLDNNEDDETKKRSDGFGGITEEYLKGKFLGSFELKNNKSATLLIGNHRLEGERVPVARPLAVLNQTSSSVVTVLGCIEERILFKTRPKPITQHLDVNTNNKKKIKL